MEIIEATEVTGELLDAFNRLIPQLTRNGRVPSRSELEEIIAAPRSTVLLAVDSSRPARIVGTLTLVVFRIPTGVRAWIEDVVVDQTARRRGVAEALTREALRRARTAGVRAVHLTSRPAREAANRLYQRLGFKRRETNLYRFELASGAG